MGKLPGVLLFPLLAAAAAGVGCCGCQPNTDESPIALAAAPARAQPANEGVFGEWVSQIIRTPAKDAGSLPSYGGAAIYDEAMHERRPMLSLTLSDDGTFALISNYTVSTRSIVFGNWTMTGTKIALEQNGEVAWVFVCLGGKLIAEKNDGPTIILGRK